VKAQNRSFVEVALEEVYYCLLHEVLVAVAEEVSFWILAKVVQVARLMFVIVVVVMTRASTQGPASLLPE
jgi:hypothetical protein